jgi:hypothetical protein
MTAGFRGGVGPQSGLDRTRLEEDEIGFKADLLGRAVLPVFPTDLTPRVDEVEQLQEGLMRMGHLTYATPLDVRPYVNTALAQRAREVLDARGGR